MKNGFGCLTYVFKIKFWFEIWDGTKICMTFGRHIHVSYPSLLLTNEPMSYKTQVIPTYKTKEYSNFLFL